MAPAKSISFMLEQCGEESDDEQLNCMFWWCTSFIDKKNTHTQQYHHPDAIHEKFLDVYDRDKYEIRVFLSVAQ